jgi:hypothetical protein
MRQTSTAAFEDGGRSRDVGLLEILTFAYDNLDLKFLRILYPGFPGSVELLVTLSPDFAIRIIALRRTKGCDCGVRGG